MQLNTNRLRAMLCVTASATFSIALIGWLLDHLL